MYTYLCFNPISVTALGFSLLFGQECCSLIAGLLFTLTAFILNEIKKRGGGIESLDTTVSIIKALVTTQWSMKINIQGVPHLHGNH